MQLYMQSRKLGLASETVLAWSRQIFDSDKVSPPGGDPLLRRF
jgi:hypothetical protein